MFAANADTYSPGDQQGVFTSSQADSVPSRSYSVEVPNILLGALGLAAIIALTHHWRR